MHARYSARFGCDETRSLANAYADNQLLVETSIEIERHLERCPHCASHIGDVHHLKKRTRHCVRSIRAPDGLAVRIRNELRNIHTAGE